VPPATPPHSLDAERSVLGAILLDNAHLGEVHLEERLTPEDFYRDTYGAVFAAMVVLHDENRPIDQLTVANQLREMGVVTEDAPVMLDELSGWVPEAWHVREYARIVREASLRRKVLLSTYEIQAGVFEQRPIRELIEDAERNMLSVADATVSELGILDSQSEMERLESVREGKEVIGVPSGFMDLDRVTGGFQAANLIVLAARPSMGKSALAVNIAENVAASGTPVAVFSLEMSRAEIVRRVLASRARVSGDALLRGPIPPHHWERVEKAVQEVEGLPMYVDEGVDAGVIDIRAKARRLHRRTGLGLVIVDYVQLMRADGGENRNVEVGAITRGLKLLSKELDVPVIAVSQLSRAVEHRQDKHPQLSDLRDSGSVEQDADLVMFLYREGYYDDEAEEPDVTELNIAKHRNGPLGRIKLTFLSSYPRFASYAPEQERFGAARTSSGEDMPF
jgi:replicative DNA helicase